MNHKRGMAIEYVILTMLLVAGLVTALLISATNSSHKAKLQRNYIERKAFLDESAQTFIEKVKNNSLPTLDSQTSLQTSFNDSPDNKYGYIFTVGAEPYKLTATKSDGVAVVLYVEFDSSGALVAYRYS